MSKQTPGAKPPTQVASVAGIAPKPITMNEPQTSADWEKLVRLPPFQMFAAERMVNVTGNDAENHAKAFVSAHGFGLSVYDDYCQWHQAKGYWPNETPLGQLITADSDILIA